MFHISAKTHKTTGSLVNEGVNVFAALELLLQIIWQRQIGKGNFSMSWSAVNPACLAFSVSNFYIYIQHTDSIQISCGNRYAT